MDDSDACDCGGEHPQPLTKEVLALYKQYKAAKSKDERLDLAIGLAEVYLLDHDFSDALSNEEYHSYFEDFQKAKVKYELCAARLARLALNITEEWLHFNDTSVEEIEARTSKTAN